MENLNAETIKKALECCLANDIFDSKCGECQYKSTGADCMDCMLRDALALITSQEQRIGELTEESERLRNRITCQVVLPDEKLEEIKNECLERVELDIKKIEADTVRKMQERLKAVAYQSIDWSHGEHPWVVEIEDIDQIAEELLEGEK